MKTRKDKENNQKNNKILYIIITILIVVIILLLLRACRNRTNTGEIQQEGIIGRYEIINQEYKKEDSAKGEERKITFAGVGEYYVSEKAPGIQLKNPDKNFVDMVFTLMDKETGEIIARTEKIPAGRFVYVNVLDFYQEKGIYNIKINISAYDSKTGAQMNGMDQEMKLIIN